MFALIFTGVQWFPFIYRFYYLGFDCCCILSCLLAVLVSQLLHCHTLYTFAWSTTFIM